MPFALHFSDSEKYSPAIFRRSHESFFIRNVNFTYIPSWSSVVASYGNYKLARFYDMNLKYILADKIRPIARRYNVFRNNEFKTSKNTKKFFKIVHEQLKEEFGRFLIIESLLHLISVEHLLLNSKHLKQYENKLKRKATKKFK